RNSYWCSFGLETVDDARYISLRTKFGQSRILIAALSFLCGHFYSHYFQPPVILKVHNHDRYIICTYPFFVFMKHGAWKDVVDDQSKRVLTDFCSCTRTIVSANKRATDNCLILGDFFSSGNAIEFVMINSLITESLMRCTAGPESTGCVQHA